MEIDEGLIEESADGLQESRGPDLRAGFVERIDGWACGASDGNKQKRTCPDHRGNNLGNGVYTKSQTLPSTAIHCSSEA